MSKIIRFCTIQWLLFGVSVFIVSFTMGTLFFHHTVTFTVQH